MAEAIRDFHEQTGRVVGLKLAGGIRTAKQSWQYLVIVGRDPRPRVAAPGPLPPRGLQPAQRPPHAATLAGHRPLPAARRLHDRLSRRPAADRPDPARRVHPRVRHVARIDRHRVAAGHLRPVHRRRVGRAPLRRPLPDDQPGHRGATGRRSPRPGAEDVDLAVAAARQAWESGWRDLPGRERAKYLYRIARLLQERSREFAVLETLDGGKPIKESRDVDLPLAAAHFFHYAGWADKLDYAFAGRRGRAARRRRPDHPLELPDAHGRPGSWPRRWPRATPWCSSRPRRTPLTALAAGRGPAGRRAAAGRGQHHHRAPGPRAPALVGHPGIDKVAFTGSTDVGKRIQTELAGHRQAPHPRARRQGGQHRLRGRRPRPGGRGHRQRHLVQPGPRLLRRAPACSCRSPSPTWSSTG